MSALNRIDPFFCLLRGMHRQILAPGLLKDHERDFVASNIAKHRKAQWLNAVATVFIVHALYTIDMAQMSTVITALLAPVMVLGGAWFAVSFGAIPAKLISCSMTITLWMYTGFKLAFTTMVVAIGFVTPWSLWPVLALIYAAVDVSCIQYDTTDGLKAGLDDAMLKHSRAALQYYAKQGIEPPAGDQ